MGVGDYFREQLIHRRAAIYCDGHGGTLDGGGFANTSVQLTRQCKRVIVIRAAKALNRTNSRFTGRIAVVFLSQAAREIESPWLTQLKLTLRTRSPVIHVEGKRLLITLALHVSRGIGGLVVAWKSLLRTLLRWSVSFRSRSGSSMIRSDQYPARLESCSQPGAQSLVRLMGNLVAFVLWLI